MSNKTPSQHPRVCSYCNKEGHNVRTCPKRLADEAKGRSSSHPPSSRSKVPPSSSSQNPPASSQDPHVIATTPVAAPLAIPPVARVPTALVTGTEEFEEVRKQVMASTGRTITGSMREYGGVGHSMVAVQIFDDRTQTTKDVLMDIETTKKVLEVLTWALQRHAVRQQAKRPLPAARPVGAPSSQPVISMPPSTPNGAISSSSPSNMPPNGLATAPTVQAPSEAIPAETH